MTTSVTEIEDKDNVVSVQEFWQRKVTRIQTLYNYDAISEDKFIKEMLHLGYTEKQLFANDEDEE